MVKQYGWQRPYLRQASELPTHQLVAAGTVQPARPCCMLCGCCTKASHVLSQPQQPAASGCMGCTPQASSLECSLCSREGVPLRLDAEVAVPEGSDLNNTATGQMLDSPLQEGTLVHDAASNPLAGTSGGSAVSCTGSCARTCASVASACPVRLLSGKSSVQWTSAHQRARWW